jgi:hypothetical protein
MNMDPAVAWVEVRAGGAIAFDGVDDTVNCGGSPSLKLVDEITVAMWVRFDTLTEFTDVPSNNLYRVFLRGGSMGNYLHFLYQIEEEDSPCDSSWSGSAGVVTQTELLAEQWYHVAGVKSGNPLSIYLNGAREAELDCLTNHAIDTSNVQSLFLGAEGLFHGALDERTIYPRALSEIEVRTLYRGAP